MDAVLASSAAERTVLEGGRGPRATSGVVEKARAQAVLLSTVLVSVGRQRASTPPTHRRLHCVDWAVYYRLQCWQWFGGGHCSLNSPSLPLLDTANLYSVTASRMRHNSETVFIFAIPYINI